MEKFVITVARETGSGGHNITRKLSEALGVPYYDRTCCGKRRKSAASTSGCSARRMSASG